jgi:hypothetical protein
MPGLAAREHAVALLLTGNGYGLRNIRTIISDAPLPDCEWCPSNPPHEANCEIFHDTGTVLSCRSCLLTAGSVAAENAENAEFTMEITERPARKYVAEVGLAHVYGAYALRDGDEWARYYVDLDELNEGAV